MSLGGKFIKGKQKNRKGDAPVVYVINKSGQPIMPTQDHRKVRLWLKEHKAKVVKRVPFTIKLKHPTKNHRQEIVLGVDAGSKGIGICAATEKQELFAG